MDPIKDFSLVVYNHDEENAIILICNREILAIAALFDVVHFDILTPELFAEHQFLGAQTVALHLEAHVTLVDDGYTIFRVICNDRRNNIEFSIDPCTEGKILEEVAVLAELGKTDNDGLITQF